MRWALENKSRLIPAFGYEKRRLAGECIKASAKLVYIQGVRGGERRPSEREAADLRQCKRSRERQSLRAQISNTHSLFSSTAVAHKHTCTPTAMHTD